MVRPFDSEMEYTDFKMVHLQYVYKRKSFIVAHAHFFVLGNLETQENKINCFPQEQALSVWY